MFAVKDQRSLRGESTELSSTRERILLDLLGKASDFYEYTIGILSSIFELTEFVSRGSPERDFYAYMTTVLIQESRCENASIFMVEDGKVVLKAAAGSIKRDVNSHVSMPLGEGVAGTCALEGRTILVDNVDECEFFKKTDSTKVSIGSMLCVPIKEGSKTIGVMNLSHSLKGFFNIHYVRVFELLGLLIGQMLTLVHLYEVFQRKNSHLSELLKEKDESLRSITERYKAVVDASEEMIFIIDRSGSVLFINNALQGLIPKNPATMSEIFDETTASQILERVSQIEAGYPAEFDLNVTIGGNDSIIGQFFIKRIEEDQVLIVMRDITARRRIEQKTMQTEKLTSLGLLTSGIAHELNNKLTPILGFADLIEGSNLNPQDQKRLSVIINSATAAKGIVESLLKFSRNKPPEKDVFDMREVIRRTINLYTPIIKKRGISIIYEEQSEPLCIRADMNCMEQVLVNFMNNSIDAIDEAEGTIWVHAFLNDGYVHVTIEDTGPGIPDELMSKVFDPFFTTKPKDKGTGLGLSICYGIIADHKGEVFLENTRNGAIATMKIPYVMGMITGETAGCADEKPMAVDDDQKKRFMIMVVEDEADLLDLMVDTLSPYYSVVTFENGRKACDHLDEYAWELIISDLRMPVMNGMEFYHEAIKKDPSFEKRFMFITGDTYDYQVKEFLESTGVTYLRKPFRIKELKDMVYKHLSYRMVAK